MSGIYFHIPFCKSKCNYCDFYSEKVSEKVIDNVVKSELAELYLRKEYLNNDYVNTIYFGGGTPSLLSVNQVNILLDEVRNCFKVSNECEITFEANPEDLTEEYLFQLYNSGITRLSIGIQSFNNKILELLGRRHDNTRLKYIIETAKRAGFDNISVDLIFGIPGMTYENYVNSVNYVINLDIQHVSAYMLSIEKNTKFFRLYASNLIKDISEEDLINQFNATIDILSKNGFFHYEISNYAKEGFISQHNSSYWKEVPYLGIGPSAHSYNLISRQWNISDIKKYCAYVGQSESFYEVEVLTENDRYNEYILKGLRTAAGISKKHISTNFRVEIVNYFMKCIDRILADDLIVLNNETITLTRKGIFLSDFVNRLFYFV
jgi:oxygen-independent coproporphyrinogen III oxidase